MSARPRSGRSRPRRHLRGHRQALPAPRMRLNWAILARGARLKVNDLAEGHGQANRLPVPVAIDGHALNLGRVGDLSATVAGAESTPPALRLASETVRAREPGLRVYTRKPFGCSITAGLGYPPGSRRAACARYRLARTPEGSPEPPGRVGRNTVGIIGSGRHAEHEHLAHGGGNRLFAGAAVVADQDGRFNPGRQESAFSSDSRTGRKLRQPGRWEAMGMLDLSPFQGKCMGYCGTLTGRVESFREARKVSGTILSGTLSAMPRVRP